MTAADATGLRRAYECIRAHFKVIVLKNKFRKARGKLRRSTSKKGNPLVHDDSKGARVFPNLHLNVLFETECCAPIVAEIQLHLHDVLVLTKQDHMLYEVKRAASIEKLLDKSADGEPRKVHFSQRNWRPTSGRLKRFATTVVRMTRRGSTTKRKRAAQKHKPEEEPRSAGANGAASNDADTPHAAGPDYHGAPRQASAARLMKKMSAARGAVCVPTAGSAVVGHEAAPAPVASFTRPPAQTLGGGDVTVNVN